MSKYRDCISRSQLFYLVFLYVLSGLMLYGGGSFTVIAFSGLFCICVCVICAALRRDAHSFKDLSSALLGRYSWVLIIISTIITAFPLVQTLYEVSFRVGAFYDSAPSFVLLFVFVALCIFAMSGGVASAARFSEMCVLPLMAVLPLSLLGGGGRSIGLAFFDTDLFDSFVVIGSVTVFLSLYLRTVDENEMSAYLQNSAFHPSPLWCGIGGVVLASCVYIFLRLVGAGSILSSFFICFFFLSRVLAIILTMSDIVGIPESGDARARVRRITLITCVSVAVLPLCVYYERLSAEIVTVCNVIFPCVLFASLMLKNGYSAAK